MTDWRRNQRVGTDWREESDRRVEATEKAYWGDLYEEKTALDHDLHENLQAAQMWVNKRCPVFNATAQKIARVVVEGIYVQAYQELDEKRIEQRAGHDEEIQFPHLQFRRPEGMK
mgnify:CR=1 FL=1